jgi:hypothetical protein
MQKSAIMELISQLDMAGQVSLGMLGVTIFILALLLLHMYVHRKNRK